MSRTPLVERVIAHIDRHGLFVPGQRVGLAVSGGADSIFLLHLMRGLAPRWHLHLSVVHIDHGIRGASSRNDAEFVEAAALEFGLPFFLHGADVPSVEGNLEQAARRIRQRFYAELISAGKLDRIATGHTASDQAETVLYRIFRGSGLAGLSGIRPFTSDNLVRPLLPLWRPEILAWLEEQNISWREDLSNQDLTFARNRLRHETLPTLRRQFNPNLDQALAHMAILAQDEEAYWERDAAEIETSAGPVGGPVILLAAELADSPAALARRRIRHAIVRVKGDLRQIDFDHSEAILEMARAGPGHNRVQLPGLDVMRSFDWIRIARVAVDSALPRDFQHALQVPGSVTLPDGRQVTFELIGSKEELEPYGRVGDEIDWRRLLSICAPEATGAGCDLLHLRNWRPGDRYHPAGQSHEKKIKTLFQEGRIPLWDRRHWPVLACGEEIVWTRRFGVAARFAASVGCFPVLHIRETSAI